MHVKVNSGQLKRAARAIVALNSFAKEKKDDAKDKDTFPCLLTAKGKHLIVESAVFGLYLKYQLDAEVKKEGKFSTIAAPLKNLPDDEQLELSRVKNGQLRIKLKNGIYQLSEVEQVEESIITGRVYDRKQIRKNCATVPFQVLKDAINSVTFKPGLSAETLRLQIRLRRGRLEVSGTDSFGMARITLRNKQVEVEKPIEAVVKTGLLSLLSAEVMAEEDEQATLGLLLDQDKQPVVLYLGTKRVELWHPVLGVPIRDYDEIIKGYYSGNKVVAAFTVENKELQSAVNTVTALWSGESASAVEFVANKGAVSVQAQVTGQNSNAMLLTEGKIEVRNERTFHAPLHYLKSFTALAPPNLPLEVKVCGEEIIHLAAQLEKSTRLEFVMSQESHGGEESSED